MNIKICTCGERPETVFVLSDEEKIFFRNDTDVFLKWINDQIENERSISECVQESIDMDKIADENARLKEQLDKSNKKNKN